MVKRKNNSIIFAVLFVVVLLSISFASANIFTDLWNSFNGKIINVPSITGYATSSGVICPSPAVYGTSVGCVNLMAGSAAFVPPPNATRNDSYSCSQGYACYVCNSGYVWNGNKCTIRNVSELPDSTSTIRNVSELPDSTINFCSQHNCVISPGVIINDNEGEAFSISSVNSSYVSLNYYPGGYLNSVETSDFIQPQRTFYIFPSGMFVFPTAIFNLSQIPSGRISIPSSYKGGLITAFTYAQVNSCFNTSTEDNVCLLSPGGSANGFSVGLINSKGVIINYNGENSTFLEMYGNNTYKFKSGVSVTFGEILPSENITRGHKEATLVSIDYSVNDLKVSNSTNSSTMSCTSGCVSNGECLPIGYRQNGEYCAANGSFVPQLGSNAACENNFECGGNVCVNNQCVSQNIIQQILNWLAKLFG